MSVPSDSTELSESKSPLDLLFSYKFLGFVPSSEQSYYRNAKKFLRSGMNILFIDADEDGEFCAVFAVSQSVSLRAIIFYIVETFATEEDKNLSYVSWYRNGEGKISFQTYILNEKNIFKISAGAIDTTFIVELCEKKSGGCVVM